MTCGRLCTKDLRNEWEKKGHSLYLHSRQHELRLIAWMLSSLAEGFQVSISATQFTMGIYVQRSRNKVTETPSDDAKLESK